MDGRLECKNEGMLRSFRDKTGALAFGVHSSNKERNGRLCLESFFVLSQLAQSRLF